MLRRPILVALAFLPLLAALSAASTVEDATVGVVAYQYDGDTFHDAPDGCSDADARWQVPVGGQTDGLLVPPDDVRDAFVFDVPRDLVGHRLRLGATDPTSEQGLAVDAFAPGCLGSILDAINWPHPEPSPPAPAAGERQVSPNLLPDHCDPERWAFVMDRLDGYPAPASVYGAWTDGTERPLPLRWANEHYAVYLADDPLDVTLKGAWANVASSWPGSFRLALGPCAVQDGGTVYGDAPTIGMGAIAFTPVRAGPHVLLVSWAGGALPSTEPPAAVDLDPTLIVEPHEVVQDPQGSAQALADFAANPPPPQDLLPRVIVPASCHFCVPGLQTAAGQVSYTAFVRTG